MINFRFFRVDVRVCLVSILSVVCACDALTGLDKDYRFGAEDAANDGASSDDGSTVHSDAGHDGSPGSDGASGSDGSTIGSDGSIALPFMSPCLDTGSPGDCAAGLMCVSFSGKGKYCTKSCTVGMVGACPSPAIGCSQSLCQPP